MSEMIAHDVSDRSEDVNIHVKVSFESLLLPESILNGLKDAGFKQPSPIQLKAIPMGRCGFDLILKSKSGTGKTLVFAVVMLDAIDVTKTCLQSLVLVPTREIAVQIQEVVCAVGKHLNGLQVEHFIGGLPLADDVKKCQTCHVAIGTPGRIRHLVTSNALKADHVKLFILDEADKLMEDSFRTDINEIYNTLPAKKQIITTSATYPPELPDFLSKYMLSPSFISVEKNSPLLLGLKQFVKVVSAPISVAQMMLLKNRQLLSIFNNISFTQCLIFTNYQSRTQSISDYLVSNGWASTYICSTQKQPERLKAIKELKDFKSRILVTTDLVSRGIDAANVDLVINYDLPLDPSTYLHRMGRAGRFGSSGVCLNLTTDAELVTFKLILGAIGGTALGVPTLPEFTGNLSELLKIEVPPENFVHGTVDKDHKFDIRKDLMEIKSPVITESKKTSEPKKGNKKKKSKTRETEQDSKSSCQSTLTEKSNLPKTPTEEINPMLELLATGKFEFFPPNEPEADKEKLFLKNKTLLDVLKIMNGPNEGGSENLIEQHLSINKEEEKKKIQIGAKMEETKENRLVKEEVACNENMEVTSQKHYVKEKVEMVQISGNLRQKVKEEENIDEQIQTQIELEKCGEDIFELGYKMIVKNDSQFWKKWLQKEETDDTPENPAEAPKIMEWVPVPTKTTAEVTKFIPPGASLTNYEHLGKHFDTCDENLWYNGLSFTDIASFDNWFYYEWDAQVHAVRNYIQQYVYTQEMSKFTKSQKKN